MLTCRKISSRFSSMALAVLIAGVGCGGDSTNGPVQHNPEAPSNPSPADGAVGQPLEVTLNWSCSDRDGDTLSYSVYIDTTSPPTLAADSITDMTFDPGLLTPGQVYYWKIVAFDPTGLSASSPVWSFSTSSFFYSTGIGNRWEYSGEWTNFNIQPDSLDSLSPDFSDYTTIVEVMGLDTLHDTLETYVFHETLTEGNDWTCHAYSYFAERADGFYCHAYSGAGCTKATPLKINARHRFYFKGQYFNTIQEIFDLFKTEIPTLARRTSDSIFYEDPPVKSLQYPLQVGSQWLYRGEDNPWRMDKKVVDWKNQNVPAGSFDCFEIQWLYDIDEDGTWDDDIEFFDYISPSGLVKRSITFRGIVITDPDTPDSLGTVDSKDESVLTDYQIE